MKYKQSDMKYIKKFENINWKSEWIDEEYENYEDFSNKIKSDLVILFDYNEEKFIKLLEILKSKNIKWVSGHEISTNINNNIRKIKNFKSHKYSYLYITRYNKLLYGYLNNLNELTHKNIIKFE